MKILEINNLRKNFGDLNVIRDLSLSVSEGEVLSIIGPSGSGKSTVLRCATMLEKMDGGDLIYLGEYAARNDADGNSVYAPKKDLRKFHRHFGLVFQNFNLFPHFNVMRNIVDAPISVDRLDKKEAEERAMALLRKLGLEDKKDAYPCQLSGGQQQRVSIARALAAGGRILLADEPTGNLDSTNEEIVVRILKQLAHEKGYLVIVITPVSYTHLTLPTN
jgi:polar amino acid transport system ATP-binding protein